MLEEEFRAAELYDERYFEGGLQDGYAGYGKSEAVLRRGFRRTAKRISEMLPTGGKLLEIGCAYGFFLLEARHYFNVFGLEVSEAAVNNACERGLAVIQEGQDNSGLKELLKTSRASFDAVVMLDVIEHLASPREVLRRVSELLRPGGVLLLTTGDAESLVARACGRYWRLMTPPQHLFFFSRRGLSQLLAEEGFEVRSIRRPWKTVPLGLAMYQVLRHFSRRPRVPAWLAQVGLPVNLWDTVEMVAIRKGSPAC